MQLRLTITSGMLSGKTFPLETGFLTIGRSENCSVRFDPRGERVASKQHAFIEARPDGYYVTDNQSTNGTLINGHKIQKVKLADGDQIQFGTNGITAIVEIAEDRAAPVAEFRAQQIENFENIVESQPQNLQNSVVSIGLGQLEQQAEPSRTGRYVGIGVTIFAIILSLIVALIMFASVGIVPAVIAAIIAFVPAMLYLLPLMWLDRYDPEPLWLLSLAFAWGALVAVIASFVINTIIGLVAMGAAGGGEQGMAVGNVVGAVISAPIFEEASKGLGLLVVLIFFRRYFDDILDGIVFAGVIALGFATVENVMYYGNAIGKGGLPGLILLFVMRGILSPFAHVTFTAMTGIGCGIARESHNGFVRIAAPVVGYFLAVLLHGFWNGMAVFGGFETFLAGYLVLEIPFFLIFVGFAFYIMYRQKKILKEMLAIDIARGLIPKEHGETAVSAFKSSGWLLGGLFSGKFRPRSKYLRAIGRLGLSYWHIQRATAAQGQTASFQQNPILREEVLKWRDQV